MLNRKLTGYVFILMSIMPSLLAETWYVGPTGKVNGPGTPDHPLRTIQAAVDRMSEGDSCIVRAGTYRETLEINISNICIRNYPGENVTLTGTDLVKGWSHYKGNIYRAPYPGVENRFSMVFIDGKHMQMARYPDNNTGRMLEPTDYHSGYDSCIAFTGEGLTRPVKFPNMPDLYPDDHWKGGYFRGITGASWANPMGIVSASSGKNLTVKPLTGMWEKNDRRTVDNDGSGEGWGFILHLNALDSEGEWFILNDTLYCQPPGGDIEKVNVEAQRRAWAIRAEGQENIKLTGINVRGASVFMHNASGCIFDSCSFTYMLPFVLSETYGPGIPEIRGIWLSGDNNEVRNCYIAHTWGHGIGISGGRNNYIFNSMFEDIGWLGRFTGSVFNYGHNTTIEHCTFGSTGRFHVRSQTKFNIRYCDLYDCMRMGQDAGSIQGVGVNFDGSEIAYNVVHDCNTLNWNDHKQFVVAFYLEDCSNYRLHHNIAYNLKTDKYPDGTFLYMGPRRETIENCEVYNNTVWNMDYRIRVWNRDKMGHIDNALIYNNIFEAELANVYGMPSLLEGYSFRNNVNLSFDSADRNFMNAAEGDFRLKSGSSAIDSGIEISGITDGFRGTAPDAGALEYGQSMWKFGANLSKSIIK